MTEPVFIGPFRLEMQDFISLKRSVGYKYNSEPGILSRFDKYLAVNHPQADALSKEAVTGWCSKTMHETAANHCSRASVIRQFSKYLSSIGIRAWILPKNYYPTGQQYVPHIYTPDELRRFFAETDKCNYCSSVPYRHLIMPEFFRLLLSCGLRCSEARLLTVGDVDLGQGVLTIRVIRYRQASDHWNEASYEVNLKLFDRHCHRFSNGAVAELSQEMVDDWCRQRKNEENNSCRSRIYVVVSFIKFLRDRGLTSVCPPEVPRKETRTYIPHAFTDEELTAFFQECDKVPVRKNNLQDACRRLTVPVFFRLPYSSGIRTNEARLLECRDVDLVNSVINVRYSKGHDQHYIVLHDTMLELMKKYNEAMSLLVPDRTYFFPSRDGSYYKKGWVTKTFRQLWDAVNASHATAYEFRHHYAVTNINLWINEGFDFDDKLLYLSKSMGHTTIESTKYYYSIVPGLSDILKRQTEEGFDWIIPEVYDNEESF